MLMLIIFLLSFGNQADSVSMNEDDFLSLLITDYNKMVRPSNKEQPITNVNHSLAIQRIVKFNSNELELDAWMPTTWTDTRLSEAADRFRDDFSHISIPQSVVWLPDITLYQRPTTQLDYEPNVLLYGSGRMVYVPSSRIWTDDCKDVGKGITECSFQFGPWSYDTDDVNLMSGGISMYEFREHQEFEIVESTAVRMDYKGPCCEGYWACIKYTLSIKRR
ncbi:unnamed protein product [Mytilus edulis]|uniref:Neurotransmitter-gated ion-channel ligand-binding domain-containing protein n=1 Tax=Mytilus edulis TaxID=6550 RepID=A0A8S3QA48_MYTED|nr:unnamed protein product [Mytilus edulis]